MTTKKMNVDEKFKEWITEKWGYEKLPIGGVVPYPKTGLAFPTGDWAMKQPKLDRDKCTGCTLCYFFCPDSVITLDEEYKPSFDLEFCKGCGICAEECPADAIDMVSIR